MGYMSEACQISRTWNSTYFSNCGSGNVSILPFTGGLRAPEDVPGPVPPIMQSTAERVQDLIRGISLPVGDDDFEGKAFVLYSAEGACNLSALFLKAFGLRFWHSCLRVLSSYQRFTEGFDDSFGYDGDDQGELERLAQAAHVLRSFGRTYELESACDDTPVPKIYFASNHEESACVGVLVGK